MHPGQARKVLNECLEEGTVRITPHAHKGLRDDGLGIAEAYEVLKRGLLGQAEWERAEWRYRVHAEIEDQAGTVYLVIAFDVDDDSEALVVVVTAWRKQ